jgi:hypothetical protein
MAAQILQTGVISLGGTTVDFSRKAASMVDLGGGSYWTTAGTDPFADMQAGCDFLRKYGLCGDYQFKVIMGTDALNAFLKNTVYNERGLSYQYKRDTVPVPSRDELGAIYHGDYDVNTYRVRVFGYEQFYTPTGATNDPANKLPYLDSTKIYILPDKPIGNTLFAATPQMITPGASTLSLVASDYVYSDYPDMRSRTHEYGVEIFGMPVPVEVDKMYTLKAVA